MKVYDDDDDDDDDDDGVGGGGGGGGDDSIAAEDNHVFFVRLRTGQPLMVSWVIAVYDVERVVFALHIGHVEKLKHPIFFSWTDTDDVVIPYPADHATTSIWISELITRNSSINDHANKLKDHDHANKPRLSVGRSSLRPWVTYRYQADGLHRRGVASGPLLGGWCWSAGGDDDVVGAGGGGGGGGGGGYFLIQCIYILHIYIQHTYMMYRCIHIHIYIYTMYIHDNFYV